MALGARGKKSGADRKRELLAAAREALRISGAARSAARLLPLLAPQLGVVEETELEDALQTESEKPESDIRSRKQGNLLVYELRPGRNETVSNLEADLYAPFCRVLEERGMSATSLDHRTAERWMNGEGRWMYPDIVAFRPGLHEGPAAAAAARTGTVGRDTLIAYELKLALTPGNLRLSFFECLSNSFWANERYVAAPIVHPDALDLFRTLARRYPVGLIEIAMGRLKEVSALRVLLDCPRSELEVEALSELARGWRDLADFLAGAGVKGSA